MIYFRTQLLARHSLVTVVCMEVSPTCLYHDRAVGLLVADCAAPDDRNRVCSLYSFFKPCWLVSTPRCSRKVSDSSS